MEDAKVREVANMILRHIPGDGRKILQSTLISRVEADYKHDSEVTMEAIVAIVEAMGKSGTTIKREAGSDRRMKCWRVETEKKDPPGTTEHPSPEPSPAPVPLPKVSLFSAFKEVSPGLIEVETKDGQVQMKLEDALTKALERDKLEVVKQKWITATEKVEKQEAVVSKDKTALNEAKAELEAAERQLRYFGFESPTTRKDDSKKKGRGRPKKTEQEPLKVQNLFEPKGHKPDAQPAAK